MSKVIEEQQRIFNDDFEQDVTLGMISHKILIITIFAILIHFFFANWFIFGNKLVILKSWYFKFTDSFWMKMAVLTKNLS